MLIHADKAVKSKKNAGPDRPAPPVLKDKAGSLFGCLGVLVPRRKIALTRFAGLAARSPYGRLIANDHGKRSKK